MASKTTNRFWHSSESSWTTLWCDNQSSIHISLSRVENQRTKHIEIHMHFIRRLIQDGLLRLEYLSTERKVADIFTKPLTSPRFLQLRSILGVKEVVSGGYIETYYLPFFMLFSLFMGGSFSYMFSPFLE